MTQLSGIVLTLGAVAGFRLDPTGERVHLIDETGKVLSDTEALSTLAALVCRAERRGAVVLPVPAPEVADELAREAGMVVERARNDGRSLVEAARGQGVQLAATMDGRFAFPPFQTSFDALFTVAKVLELLMRTGLSLGEIRQAIPRRAYRHVDTPCPRELKGGIMRKMREDSVDLEASFIDGVKVRTGDAWVLIIPDRHRPVARIVAETADEERAEKLLETYRHKVEEWKWELQAT